MPRRTGRRPAGSADEGPLARARPLRRGAGTCSAPGRPRRTTTTCCSSSTGPSTRSGPTPTGPTCSSTRPRSGPSWSPSTGVATSPTTGRASWSATRSGRSVPAPTAGRARPPGRAGGHRRPGRARGAAGRVGRLERLPGRVGGPDAGCPARRAAEDRRHRGAHGTGAGPPTGSPSTWPPTWRCSTTSCRAGSPTGRHLAGRRRAGRVHGRGRGDAVSRRPRDVWGATRRRRRG